MLLKKRFCFLLLLNICWAITPMASAATNESCPKIRVCFTPGEYCTGEIVDVIDGAKYSLYIQAYSFTSAPIARAVAAAKRRGIEVRVILDKSNKMDKYSAARFLLNQGVPTWIDTRIELAHNKVMIIDERWVVTGSFNFTNAAQKRNAENVLIIDDPAIAKKYLNNWQSRFALSEPLTATAKANDKYFTKSSDTEELVRAINSLLKKIFK